MHTRLLAAKIFVIEVTGLSSTFPIGRNLNFIVLTLSISTEGRGTPPCASGAIAIRAAEVTLLAFRAACVDASIASAAATITSL